MVQSDPETTEGAMLEEILILRRRPMDSKLGFLKHRAHLFTVDRF